MRPSPEDCAEELHAMPPQALHAYRLEQASSVKLPYLVIALGADRARHRDREVQPAAHSRSRRRTRGRERQRLEASQPDTGRRSRSSATSARKSRSAASWSTYMNLSEIGNLRAGSRREVSDVLLGRRDDRAVHRLGGAAENFHARRTGLQCHRRGGCWCACRW